MPVNWNAECSWEAEKNDVEIDRDKALCGNGDEGWVSIYDVYPISTACRCSIGIETD